MWRTLYNTLNINLMCQTRLMDHFSTPFVDFLICHTCQYNILNHMLFLLCEFLRIYFPLNWELMELIWNRLCLAPLLKIIYTLPWLCALLINVYTSYGTYKIEYLLTNCQHMLKSLTMFRWFRKVDRRTSKKTSQRGDHIFHLNVVIDHTWYLSRTPRIYLCKIFLAGVNFYRFNVKNWHFRQILREKVAFFTDLTRKIGVFRCKFYSPKILPV